MKRSYSWLAYSEVTGTIAPLRPADALPVGPVMTADEVAAWKALWDDRLERGVITGPVHVSVFHDSASPCESTCPNRVHRKDES